MREDDFLAWENIFFFGPITLNVVTKLRLYWINIGFESSIKFNATESLSFIVLAHLLKELKTIIDNFFEHLDLVFADGFLKRHHIEVVEVSKVEIHLGSSFHSI